jgi:hypothetical protein
MRPSADLLTSCARKSAHGGDWTRAKGIAVTPGLETCRPAALNRCKSRSRTQQIATQQGGRWGNGGKSLNYKNIQARVISVALVQEMALEKQVEGMRMSSLPETAEFSKLGRPARNVV